MSSAWCGRRRRTTSLACTRHAHTEKGGCAGVGGGIRLHMEREKKVVHRAAKKNQDPATTGPFVPYLTHNQHVYDPCLLRFLICPPKRLRPQPRPPCQLLRATAHKTQGERRPPYYKAETHSHPPPPLPHQAQPWNPVPPQRGGKLTPPPSCSSPSLLLPPHALVPYVVICLSTSAM